MAMHVHVLSIRPFNVPLPAWRVCVVSTQCGQTNVGDSGSENARPT